MNDEENFNNISTTLICNKSGDLIMVIIEKNISKNWIEVKDGTFILCSLSEKDITFEKFYIKY